MTPRKIVILTLLASLLASAPLFGEDTQGSQASATAASDASLKDVLARVQAMAQKSDADLARLHIDKWKADSANKQQAQSSADSIHRNLVNAVPDLVQLVQASPNSLSANFRLYRDLNALFETFAALAESAGAFGPADQYSPLAADLTQMDQVRQQIADRLDLLAGTNDTELARLRTRPAAAPAKAAAASSKVVVDDNQPSPKKKRKSSPSASKP
jgi:hypothetical protein